MLHLLTPPTDNLYKFLALSGLALLLISFVYPTNLVSDLELKVVEAKTRIELLEAEGAHIQEDSNIAKSRDSKSANEMPSLQQRRRELRLKTIQATGEAQRLGVLVAQAKYAFCAQVIGCLLGLVVACLGFVFWYVKVQKPADQAALRPQVNEDAA